MCANKEVNSTVNKVLFHYPVENHSKYQMLPADSRAAKDHITTKICAKCSTVLLIIIEIYSDSQREEMAIHDNYYMRKYLFVCKECSE